jgi:dCMP deaminase
VTASTGSLALPGCERPGWDEYGLGLAQAASVRSDCIRRQVGAVILTNEHRLAGGGYNASPSGTPGCCDGACPRARSDVPSGTGDYDNCTAIHAESNSIMFSSPTDRRDATIYITHVPCSGCRKLIQGSGIVRIVTPEGSEQLWEPHH